MKHRWDACNKWLYLGDNEQWTILLDEWFNWFLLGSLSIRTWSLFRIAWDNGAWWAFDLDNAIILNGKKHGKLAAFVEVTIFGIGIRRWYNRAVIFDEEEFRKSFSQEMDGIINEKN